MTCSGLCGPTGTRQHRPPPVAHGEGLPSAAAHYTPEPTACRSQARGASGSLRQEWTIPLQSVGNQLLAAVYIVGSAGERFVAHDVDGQSGDVRRAYHPADGKFLAQLVPPRFELIAQQRGRKGRVDESGGD